MSAQPRPDEGPNGVLWQQWRTRGRLGKNLLGSVIDRADAIERPDPLHHRQGIASDAEKQRGTLAWIGSALVGPTGVDSRTIRLPGRLCRAWRTRKKHGWRSR